MSSENERQADPDGREYKKLVEKKWPYSKRRMKPLADQEYANKRHFGRRKSDIDILHCAKDLICCEKALNHQVDKLLESVGLTRREVENGSAYELINNKRKDVDS